MVQKTINLSHKKYDTKSILSSLLPAFVFLSFIWLNLYSSLASSSVLNFLPSKRNMFLTILLSGAFAYLFFELLFLVYRLFIGFSIYSFMIPKRALLDSFRVGFFLRNLVLGLIYNLRFAYPFLSTYLCVFDLLFNFLCFMFVYLYLSKSYVEPLVGQFVFKTLSVPIFIYEIASVLMLVAGVI